MNSNGLPALQVSGLYAGYRGREVIRDLTLPPVLPGQVMSLIGPNAAGKSTLLRALAGLLPARGSVKLGDRELIGLPLSEHANVVTYTPQELPQQIALTVLETVISALQVVPDGKLTHDEVMERSLAVLERLGISHLAMESLDHLSGGQRQLTSLAQTLVRQPQVLLLDEPISALDLHYQLRVMKLVREVAREQGMIVVVVLHDLSIAARWSDQIVVLAKGKVEAAGTPEQAITAEVLSQVYHVSARIERCSAGSFNVLVDDVI
ncbi:MAG TPA: ABC transporter ATP-binding protein [Pseudohongiella sp.]|nr:ABC transporter ATP-binding protein [Pseudohongiella sp.]